MSDRYGPDVLSGDWRAPGGGRSVPYAAELGAVVEEIESGWTGSVVRVEKAGGMQVVHLEDRRGRVRGFPLGPGFLVDGRPVILTRPQTSADRDLAATRAATSRSASGSRTVAAAPTRVARASRIFVEGTHDAELIEKVWGHDLRVEGVVVQPMGGIEDLEAIITDFAPGPGRRLGVLLDHLVPGAKESLVAARAAALQPYAAHLLIVGHPFVDVWQSVRPQRLRLDRWPVIPRETSWKHGMCAALGWPHESQADIARAWQVILSTVRSYADLEPSLVGRVEELIDFVTAPSSLARPGC